MNMVQAPWTDDQVSSLNCYQLCGPMHPFTCPNRGDGRHRPIQLSGGGEADLGALLATAAGWRCLTCDYTQDWAWTPMADWSWRRWERRQPDGPRRRCAARELNPAPRA